MNQHCMTPQTGLLAKPGLLRGRQRSRLGFGSFALIGIDGPQPKANHQKDPCNQASKNLSHPWVGDNGRILRLGVVHAHQPIYSAPARMQPYPWGACKEASTSGSRTSTQRPSILRPAMRPPDSIVALMASVNSYSPRGDARNWRCALLQ